MKRLYTVIFLVSCSALALEISLIRLFSIYLSYHFAFMVISIAMLGIGAAGTVLSLYPALRRDTNIGLYALLAGASMLAGYLVSNCISFEPVELAWNKFELLYIAAYCIVLSIPFFFAGLVISSAFYLWSEKSGTIYCSDLLGAGMGSLVALGLLHVASPEYTVLAASTLCFVAALFIAGRRLRYFIPLLIALNLVLIIVHPHLFDIRLSPYKSLSLALKYPGSQHLGTYYNSFSRVDTLISPAARFAPGLSLTYLRPLPEQIGLTIDGGEMNAVTDAHDREKLAFTEFLPSALAYEMIRGRPEDSSVLVLEPKGGLQPLVANYYGHKNVDKVESNPLLLRVVRDELGEFSGNLYKRNIWTGLGRSWLRKGKGGPRYDIIDISTANASVSGSFGISEDFRFTVEAFEEYLSSLKEEGIISLSFYLIPPPRTELRILATAIAALNLTGVKDASQHIAAIRSWDIVTILVKSSPLIEADIKRLKEFSRTRRFDLVYYPGMDEAEANHYVKMPTNEYFFAFQDILNPDKRESFMRNYLFDIQPVNDDNPFFGYYLKLRNIRHIYEVMGDKWEYFIEEGYLLPAIFVQVALLCVLAILLPAFSLGWRGASPSLMYFAMLGLGFMFVEVTLIHKSILALENPPYAVATILTAILISSGVGSFISGKIRKATMPYALIALMVLICIYSFVFSLWINILSPLALPVKTLLIFVSLLPLGFFMGIPFPLGMRLLGQKNPSLIPWAWATNGCLSVLAPILTIMIAMAVGFRIVLWLGAGAYLVAFLAFLLHLSNHGNEAHSA